jgi:hypothetical protein
MESPQFFVLLTVSANHESFASRRKEVSFTFISRTEQETRKLG